MALNWENKTRVRKEIGKGKERNRQEERKTGNMTVDLNYTSELNGTELGKCDSSDGQRR